MRPCEHYRTKQLSFVEGNSWELLTQQIKMRTARPPTPLGQWNTGRHLHNLTIRPVMTCNSAIHCPSRLDSGSVDPVAVVRGSPDPHAAGLRTPHTARPKVSHDSRAWLESAGVSPATLR